jgi:hypothetical protein
MIPSQVVPQKRTFAEVVREMPALRADRTMDTGRAARHGPATTASVTVTTTSTTSTTTAAITTVITATTTTNPITASSANTAATTTTNAATRTAAPVSTNVAVTVTRAATQTNRRFPQPVLCAKECLLAPSTVTAGATTTNTTTTTSTTTTSSPLAPTTNEFATLAMTLPYCAVIENESNDKLIIKKEFLFDIIGRESLITETHDQTLAASKAFIAPHITVLPTTSAKVDANYVAAATSSDAELGANMTESKSHSKPAAAPVALSTDTSHQQKGHSHTAAVTNKSHQSASAAAPAQLAAVISDQQKGHFQTAAVTNMTFTNMIRESAAAAASEPLAAVTSRQQKGHFQTAADTAIIKKTVKFIGIDPVLRNPSLPILPRNLSNSCWIDAFIACMGACDLRNSLSASTNISDLVAVHKSKSDIWPMIQLLIRRADNDLLTSKDVAAFRDLLATGLYSSDKDFVREIARPNMGSFSALLCAIDQAEINLSILKKSHCSGDRALACPARNAKILDLYPEGKDSDRSHSKSWTRERHRSINVR